MTDNRKVLLVDDEVSVLRGVYRILRKAVDVTTASSPEEALQHIRKSGPFAVVISDQNMPGMDGITLLGQIAKLAPTTTRIMLTGDNDQKTAVNAVNDGRIFRFITKPCESALLARIVAEGIGQHRTLTAERELLEQALSGSVKVLVDVVALSKPLAHLRATLIQRWARKVSEVLHAKPPLEHGMAAMLCTLGYLTLPDSLADRYFKGEALSPDERRIVNEGTAQARDLILNIPRMEAIAEAIYYCRKGFDGTGFPDDGRRGEDLPDAARMLCALIDLAEIVSIGTHSFQAAMAELERNAPRYDPRVLAAMQECLGSDQVFAGSDEAVRKAVPVAHLISGDTVASDIRDADGRLLLAAGSPLSALTIRRLRGVQSLTASDVVIDIWRAVGKTEEAITPPKVVS